MCPIVLRRAVYVRRVARLIGSSYIEIGHVGKDAAAGLKPFVACIYNSLQGRAVHEAGAARRMQSGVNVEWEQLICLLFGLPHPLGDNYINCGQLQLLHVALHHLDYVLQLILAHQLTRHLADGAWLHGNNAGRALLCRPQGQQRTAAAHLEYYGVPEEIGIGFEGRPEAQHGYLVPYDDLMPLQKFRVGLRRYHRAILACYVVLFSGFIVVSYGTDYVYFSEIMLITNANWRCPRIFFERS